MGCPRWVRHTFIKENIFKKTGNGGQVFVQCSCASDWATDKEFSVAKGFHIPSVEERRRWCSNAFHVQRLVYGKTRFTRLTLHAPFVARHPFQYALQVEPLFFIYLSIYSCSHILGSKLSFHSTNMTKKAESPPSSPCPWASITAYLILTVHIHKCLSSVFSGTYESVFRISHNPKSQDSWVQFNGKLICAGMGKVAMWL